MTMPTVDSVKSALLAATKAVDRVAQTSQAQAAKAKEDHATAQAAASTTPAVG